MALASGLYIVATPIGNLADMTFRAVDTLKSVDLILCEDTRHTATLCVAYDIRTPRSAYHDHNADAARPGVLARLAEGAAVALVSDAGTPLISDPGFKLVRAARAAGHAVFPIPGPSAITAALSAAGAPSDRFLFVGFLPAKAAARDGALRALAPIDATLVFYDAPQRVGQTLAAMASIFGPERQATIAREMTKLHEEFRSGALAALAEAFGDDVRGEIVILVEPPPATAADATDLDRLLRMALATMGVKDAAEAVAAATGMPRRDVYRRALELKA